MIEQILYEEQIAPPMLGAHLVEALVNVINRSVANVGIDQIHAQHDDQVQRTQSQIAMKEELAEKTQILAQIILTHCLELFGVAEKVVCLQETTKSE